MTEAARTNPSREEAVLLELVRTADILSRRPAEVFKAAELSPTQYNVLRILRTAEPPTCTEIGKRMITRDPDITRLLDRLVRLAMLPDYIRPQRCNASPALIQTRSIKLR